MGWSAGGNLALAAAQLPSLSGRIAAVAPMYPVADFSPPAEEKLPSRQWKPALGGYRAQTTDGLMMITGLAEWAYVSQGQNLRDPLLSPVFATREALPQRMFIVAAELDMLAHEAYRLAWSLAGKQGAPPAQVGRAEVAPDGELVFDDEQYHFEEGGV